MAIFAEFQGPLACFTRPEMKVERVSYEVPTPSAARGMIESIYYHPGMRWHIDRIWVLNPIQFATVRRNEVETKILATKMMQEANGGKQSRIITSQDIQQRSTLMLKNVHYVFEAHFDMTERASASDNPGKFQDIIKRRLRRGACYAMPYLGCRECVAQFGLWEEADIPAIDETRDLGIMLYDMDYSNPDDIIPMFFHAKMEHGVIDLRDCEVIR